MKSLLDFILNDLKDLVEQTRAHETRFKQPQNGVGLSSKPTPRSKRNRTREKHKERRYLQKKKNNLASLRNEASKRVGIFDML
jgi:hypothetical protein